MVDRLERLEEAATAGEWMADLVRKLLEYTGKASFFKTRIAIGPLVRDTVESLLPPPNIELRLDLPLHLAEVEADPGKLQVVLEVLLTNAYEAIGDAPGVVRVTAGMEVHEGRAFVVLTTEDTGVGMNREVLAKIFEPFYSTKFLGRGLGLSAALGIIRSHDGRISVNSVPGKGTSFEVRLPAAEEEGIDVLGSVRRGTESEVRRSLSRSTAPGRFGHPWCTSFFLLAVAANLHMHVDHAP